MRLVKRCEGYESFETRDHRGIDQDRSRELVATMHHAVARSDKVEFPGDGIQPIQNRLQHGRVIELLAALRFEFRIGKGPAAAVARMKVRVRRINSIDQAVIEQAGDARIDNLEHRELDRRRAGVHDQDAARPHFGAAG